MPSLLVPAAPKGGLPVTYPSSGSGIFAITNTIDDKLKAPYTINLDFSIGREFGHGFFVQGSYVGRLSRHSLIQRDLAEPTDLRDPKSGQNYFAAMTQLATLLDFKASRIANLPKIPFFENMWSGAAAVNPVWAAHRHPGLGPGLPRRSHPQHHRNSNPGDFTNTLNNADNAANCGKATTVLLRLAASTRWRAESTGPFMMFNPQFSALSAYSSIGKAIYHAMQWTVRKRFSDGLLST